MFFCLYVSYEIVDKCNSLVDLIVDLYLVLYCSLSWLHSDNCSFCGELSAKGSGRGGVRGNEDGSGVRTSSVAIYSDRDGDQNTSHKRK